MDKFTNSTFKIFSFILLFGGLIIILSPFIFILYTSFFFQQELSLNLLSNIISWHGKKAIFLLAFANSGLVAIASVFFSSNYFHFGRLRFS